MKHILVFMMLSLSSACLLSMDLPFKSPIDIPNVGNIAESAVKYQMFQEIMKMLTYIGIFILILVGIFILYRIYENHFGSNKKR